MSTTSITLSTWIWIVIKIVPFRAFSHTPFLELIITVSTFKAREWTTRTTNTWRITIYTIITNFHCISWALSNTFAFVNKEIIYTRVAFACRGASSTVSFTRTASFTTKIIILRAVACAQAINNYIGTAIKAFSFNKEFTIWARNAILRTLMAIKTIRAATSTSLPIKIVPLWTIWDTLSLWHKITINTS